MTQKSKVVTQMISQTDLNRFKSYLRTSTFKENSFQFACGGVNHLSANNIHEKVRESKI
jgi:hypothetical protein